MYLIDVVLTVGINLSGLRESLACIISQGSVS